MKKQSNCEDCAYYIYDDDYECYTCEVNLDEDEFSRFIQGSFSNCPYYNQYDEYKVVRKQN